MKQKHIVVVDGVWVGHHPVYVKAFARILLEAGYQVSVLCPAPEDMKMWIAQTATPDEAARFRAYDFIDEVLTLPSFLPERLKLLLICLGRWLHVSYTLKKMSAHADRPNMIFFAWLDSYLNRYVPVWCVDWQFPFAWSGLYFHPFHHRVKRRFHFLANHFPFPERLVAKSRLACSLAVLDAGVIHKLRAQIPEKKAFIFPDFTDELPPANDFHLTQEILAKAKGRKIIGLLGSLELRKGMMTLLRMAQQPAARDWYFIFAGELAEQTISGQELKKIKSFFDVPRENCLAFFHRIPEDSQFNALVNVCDVIFAAYQGFPHSSNIVTKAAAYGKPLIVSAGGYMEEVVKQYDLGEVVPEEDVEATLAALVKLTARDSSHERIEGMRAYFMEQSQDKLRQIFLELVESCIGHVVESGMADSAKSAARR